MAGIFDLSQSLGFGKYDPTSGLVDQIFKEFYLPGVRDQLNNKRVMARLFNKRAEHQITEGRYTVIALATGRNESSISIAERGRLPMPLKQSYDQAQYRMRYQYGRLALTGQAMGSSKTTVDHSFVLSIARCRV